MTRSRQLPTGWYPSDPQEIRNFCEPFLSSTPEYRAAVVPHAGWYFSGKLAAQTIAGLKRAETVVVVGGHLHVSDSIHVAMEDGFDTPLGPIAANTSLRDELRDSFDTRPDAAADNTVEVQLPLVAALLDPPSILYLRCPPSAEAAKLGTFLAKSRTAHSVAVIGSTDLTHYGPSYGFTGHGTGDSAASWVAGENDRRFIEAACSLDDKSMVQTALRDRSACSAGAAATAAAFARVVGANRAEIVGSHTSYDIAPGSSIVGYVGIGYKV